MLDEPPLLYGGWLSTCNELQSLPLPRKVVQSLGLNPIVAHLQVQEDAAGDVLAGTSLREEGVESVVAAADGLVAGHLAIGLDA